MNTNTLVRWENKWNPFREMDDLQGRLNALIGRAFGRMPMRGDADTDEALTLSAWAPLVDITEDEKAYLIKAELPEVKKEDLKVAVEDGVLTLSGERKFEKEEKGNRYHRVERAYGSFARSFTVPDDADADKVRAEFKDGVLLVRLEKSEKAKPKTLEVQVA
jgi:HSP20 family protein